jgi:hypothetical protein
VTDPCQAMTYREPTLLERALAAIPYTAYWLCCAIVPARWLLHKGTVRGRIAVWIYAGAYWYGERMDGRI